VPRSVLPHIQSARSILTRSVRGARNTVTALQPIFKETWERASSTYDVGRQFFETLWLTRNHSGNRRDGIPKRTWRLPTGE